MIHLKRTLLPLALSLAALPALSQEPRQYIPDLSEMMKTYKQQDLDRKNIHTINGVGGGLPMLFYTPSMNKKWDYSITMKDSSNLEVKNTRLELDKEQQKFYLVYEDKSKPRNDSTRNRKVYPNETLLVTRVTPLREQSVGYAVEDCWLFPEIKGKITLFVTFPDVPNEFREEQYVRGYNVDNGPVLPWNSNEMRKIMAADRDAAALYASGEYIKAVKLFNKNAKKAAEKAEKEK